MKPKPLDSLTCARFFAAACVVVSHLHLQGIISVKTLFNFLDGGRPAVAFFFVLSGFVLAYNYRHVDRAERKDFWVARFARIYPVHILALGIAAIPMAILLSPGHEAMLETAYAIRPSYGTVGGFEVTSLVMAAASLVVQLALLSAWLPFAPLIHPWNGPAWSISCEAFFYACFPFLLKAIQSWSNMRLLAALAIGWVAQGALIAALTLTNAPAPFLSQHPIAHLYEFFLGIGLAEIFARHRLEWLRRNVGVVLSACALVGFLLGCWPLVSPRYYLLSPVFGVAILALAASDQAWDLLPGKRIFVLLGESSFSLYLIHMPIITLYVATGIQINITILSLSIIAASVTCYIYFEEPMRRMIRKSLSTQR